MMKHVVVVATCYCLVRPLIFCVRFTFVGKETARFLKPPFIWISKINTNRNAVMVCNSKSCRTWVVRTPCESYMLETSDLLIRSSASSSWWWLTLVLMAWCISYVEFAFKMHYREVSKILCEIRDRKTCNAHCIWCLDAFDMVYLVCHLGCQ